MTQGHDIVADGWEGASNPHPHLNTQTFTKVSKTLVFPHFHHGWTDGRIDGRTKPLIELRVRN